MMIMGNIIVDEKSWFIIELCSYKISWICQSGVDLRAKVHIEKRL